MIGAEGIRVLRTGVGFDVAQAEVRGNVLRFSGGWRVGWHREKGMANERGWGGIARKECLGAGAGLLGGFFWGWGGERGERFRMP